VLSREINNVSATNRKVPGFLAKVIARTKIHLRQPP
jgi:hypothetical protein